MHMLLFIALTMKPKKQGGTGEIFLSAIGTQR